MQFLKYYIYFTKDYFVMLLLYNNNYEILLIMSTLKLPQYLCHLSVIRLLLLRTMYYYVSEDYKRIKL